MTSSDTPQDASWLIARWSAERAMDLEYFWDDGKTSKGEAIVLMLAAVAGQRDAMTPLEFETDLKVYCEIMRHFHKVACSIGDPRPGDH